MGGVSFGLGFPPGVGLVVPCSFYGLCHATEQHLEWASPARHTPAAGPWPCALREDSVWLTSSSGAPCLSSCMLQARLAAKGGPYYQEPEHMGRLSEN